MTPPQLLDFASVFVFALTGGLSASRAQLDVVGFLFVGCLTAVGGGTARDVLLNRDPVFWVGDPIYIGVASLAALLVFFGAHRLESRYRVLLWLDALALSVAVSAGISAAVSVGASWVIALIMGVVTGCLGGLLRDVVCNEVPLVLKQGELYVTAAAVGAATGVAGLTFLDNELAAFLACVVVTFCLRAGSLVFGWRLPTYKSRQPKA
jgi:uncharacterized membrane protein YeiH